MTHLTCMRRWKRRNSCVHAIKTKVNQLETTKGGQYG